jgi:hypothetical protein
MGKYKKDKDRRIVGRFLALPYDVLRSPAYRDLGHPARSLLLDIAIQFCGDNNGKLVACRKYLTPLGWTSNDTVTRALRDLKAAGLLIETRMGMKPNRAAWFALGWKALDVAPGMDIDPRTYRRGSFGIEPLKPSGGARAG